MKLDLKFFAASVCLLLVQKVLAQRPDEADTPEANPGRPTVSTPATLTPVGYLQFENGLLYAAQSQEFSTRTGINQVTKLTVSSRLQALALFEPYVHSHGDGPENHTGEVFLGVQGVVLPSEGSRPAVSVSYIHRLYASPAPEIDIGTFHRSATVLVSGDALGFHFDLNGIATEQGDSGVRRAQFGQTLSVSHPAGRFTVSAEIWHFSQPLTRGNAVGNLWAASYPFRKNLVLDAGFDHGLTSTSTQWEGFAGFTYLLPRRLWKAHGLR